MPPLRPFLRRVLEIDRPHPTFEGEALEHEVRRHYRWNMAVSVGEVGLFFFGMSFIASTTILPLFISKLTSSTLAVGLVALLAQGGWYLPQLFTAHATERVRRMLPIMVNVGFFAERLPLWALVVAASLAVRAPAVALILTVAGFAWFSLGGGAIAPAWQQLVARCFPVDRRGFFMGFGSSIGTGFGVLGAAASVGLLAGAALPGELRGHLRHRGAQRPAQLGLHDPDARAGPGAASAEAVVAPVLVRDRRHPAARGELRLAPGGPRHAGLRRAGGRLRHA